jgi:hypothetical protein
MQPTHTPLDIIKRFESQTSPALDVSVSELADEIEKHGVDEELTNLFDRMFFDHCTTAHHDDTTDPYYDD